MTQNHIISHARRYLGTKFQHQGRSIYGLDCLGLLMMVAKDADLRDVRGRALYDYDNTHYPHVPNGDIFMQQLGSALQNIEIHYAIAGDVALFSVDGNPQHCGILTTYQHGGLGIIHAYAPARKVVEHALSKDWRNALVATFRI